MPQLGLQQGRQVDEGLLHSPPPTPASTAQKDTGDNSQGCYHCKAQGMHEGEETGHSQVTNFPETRRHWLQEALAGNKLSPNHLW